MDCEQAKSILGWLKGADVQRDDDTGTSYSVILPESLWNALIVHLESLEEKDVQNLVKE